MQLLNVTRKDAGGIPNAVRPALHVVAEQSLMRADRLPVAGRLSPRMNAFVGRVQQVLSRPAFGTNFASDQAAGKLCVDRMKATAPVVMALQADAGLMPGVIFGLAGQERA